MGRRPAAAAGFRGDPTEMSERVENVVPVWVSKSLGLGDGSLVSHQAGQNEQKRILGMNEVLGILTYMEVQKIRAMRCSPEPCAASLLIFLYIS